MSSKSAGRTIGVVAGVAIVVGVLVLQQSGILFTVAGQSRLGQVSATLPVVTMSLVGDPVRTGTTIVGVGGGSATFAASETLKLLVTSSQPGTSIDLSAFAVPKGIWIHFIPNTVTAGPGGSSVELVLAGAVIPNGLTPDDSTVQIHAAFAGSSGMNLPLTLVKEVDFSVLQSPSSTIDFNSTVITDSSNSIPKIVGAVYDPSGVVSAGSTPLPVAFSVTGINVSGVVAPLPQGLQLSLPQPLSLTAYQPSYFSLGVITKNVPVGTYHVVISETVGTQQNTSILTVVVEPPIYGHPAT